MKVIRVHQFGGPEVLKIEEIPVPEPKPGQVLVRVHAIGVNPVETYIRAGAYPVLPRVPFTPGKDAAGTVAAVGGEVKGFAVGQRVYTSNTISGAYAKFTVCDAGDIHPLPGAISFAQGACLNVPYATACRALFQKARAKAGEWVLVHGASGGVGIAAVQFARAAGLKVIGTASTERGRKLVVENGAHHGLDHGSPRYLEQVKELRSEGVDVILEMLANVNLANDLSVLAKGGRVVVIGNRGTIEINPRDLMSRDAEILGMVLFNATPLERAEIHSRIAAGLENGTLRPVVGKELPLAEAPEAHRLIMQPGAFGKIVLTT